MERGNGRDRNKREEKRDERNVMERGGGRNENKREERKILERGDWKRD